MRSPRRAPSGVPEDDLAIHNWFDETKETFRDLRHRVFRHHAEGIFEAERIFGVTVANSEGKVVPVRYIGEQHVQEDCGLRRPHSLLGRAALVAARHAHRPPHTR